MEEKTWYYDGENTHGIKGLAFVTDEVYGNLVGIGPDGSYTGTALMCAIHLHEAGYKALETDVPELRAAWNAYQQAMDNPPVRVIGAHDVEGYAMELYVAGFLSARIWMFENIGKEEALNMWEKAQEMINGADDGS
jgi:hypothetical protein